MNPWEWSEFWDDTTRLAAAAILGGALGLEREWKGHWAGLRTHMMVSIGSALFVISGLMIAKGQAFDTTRVIQGIASGIGFLGAGAILTARSRRRGFLWVGTGVAIAMVIHLVALAVGRSLYLDVVTKTLSKNASGVAYDLLVHFPRVGSRARRWQRAAMPLAA